MAPTSRRPALIVACLLSLAACGQHEVANPPARPAPTIPIQPTTDPAGWSLPGLIAPRESTPLSFREAGLITQRFAVLGDTIRAGQVLAVLDDTPWRQNLAAAQAQYEAARTTLDIARRQLKRDQAQAHEQLISPAQLDQTRGQYAQAQAQYEQAAQARAHAEDQLAYTRLAADHAGIITAEQAQTGQNIQAGGAVYTLAWGGTDVVIDVPAPRLKDLAPGLAADVAPTADPRRHYAARVRTIAGDASPATRSFQVRLALAAQDAPPPLGTTVVVRFQRPPDARPRYVLPASALFHDGDKPAVWLVRPDGTLALQAVELLAHGGATVTVTGGLAPGLVVLAQGAHTVSAGERVRATAWRPDAPETADTPGDAPPATPEAASAKGAQ